MHFCLIVLNVIELPWSPHEATQIQYVSNVRKKNNSNHIRAGSTDLMANQSVKSDQIYCAELPSDTHIPGGMASAILYGGQYIPKYVILAVGCFHLPGQLTFPNPGKSPYYTYF